MKITVINGNSRKQSTWNCKELLIKALSKYSDTEVTEFTLPEHMPHFCNGCFSCFFNGENTCPHAGWITPIVSAFENSDVIILTSSVYAMDVSASMKALLDHLCFMWVSHRPNPKMFNKVGVTMTITAGAGLSHTEKTMKDSLKYWGVKKIFTFRKRAAAFNWSGVTEKNKARIEKDTVKLAKKITHTVAHIDNIPAGLFIKLLFKAMRSMQIKNSYNKRDRSYWEAKGWLGSTKPF